MARLSPWQQFANNYKATKGAFDDMFQGIETKKIMDEEVETRYAADAGLSPHAAGPTKWSYGGQIYDKQITPDMLKGLQNKRISDVMTRYGDVEGGLKMQLDQALLTKYGDESALAQGTLSEQIRKVKLENDALVKTMDLTTAQINRINTLAPLEASKYIADIASQKQQTAARQAKLPAELKKLMAESDMSEQEAKEFLDDKAIKAREGLIQTQVDQTEVDQEKLKLEKAKLTSTYENSLATFIFDSGTAKNESEAAEMASKLNLDGNKTLTEFATKMGNKEFKNPEEQKKWLMDNWNGDQRVLDMVSTIDATELAALTAEGTKTMAEINNALSGKSSNAAKDALIKVIDMQDGIQGNMKFGKDDKGNTVLYEDGKAVITGHGAGWTAFTESLYAEFTPLKSLEIAKSNAETKKLLAEAAYKDEQASMEQRAREDKIWADHRRSTLYQQQLNTAILAWENNNDIPNTPTPYTEIERKLREEYFASTPGGTDYTGWSSKETTN